MELSSVGAVLTAETQRQTLEKVNVSLLKQSQNQQEDLTNQLLESVAPPARASSSNSSLGQHVDIIV
ncbi:MAG: putative motility protein [Alteromonadaceae bacterium]|nr:putative motility protein [Alteromonadaceae bacterium]